jgi:hypothetical protein
MTQHSQKPQDDDPIDPVETTEASNDEREVADDAGVEEVDEANTEPELEDVRS